MKHKPGVTVLLLLLFLTAHFIGLLVLNSYKNEVKQYPYELTPPKVETTMSAVQIIVSIIIVTIIALVLIKFQARRIWKVWFLFSLVVTMLLAFSAFISETIALLLALVLALWRIFKNNVVLHNFTEVFVYGGLASIFVPILNVIAVSILLLVLAVYDFWAVYKTKHMVKMAKFQTENKVFAGLVIPYGKRTAILGGGDIGFTLLFSGVIFYKYGLVAAVLSSIIIAFSLLFLLVYGKKNKFYPAMPVLAAGCFIALGVVYLLSFFGVL